MEFEYNYDADGGIHFVKHGVTMDEIEEAFERGVLTAKNPVDESGKSRLAFSKVASGRFLRIVYRQIESDTLFIITAFDATKGDRTKYLPIWERRFQ
ncbi:MAG TPA: DUF4258 domain-containing protein [Spirochaetes bacterium]|nr:DUF4258 domain-containing protein [Spirochaetota bacterium]